MECQGVPSCLAVSLIAVLPRLGGEGAVEAPPIPIPLAVDVAMVVAADGAASAPVAVAPLGAVAVLARAEIDAVATRGVGTARPHDGPETPERAACLPDAVPRDAAARDPRVDPDVEAASTAPVAGAPSEVGAVALGARATTLVRAREVAC